VDELDDETDGAHDDEADADGLADLDEFALIGLCAAVHELGAFLEEFTGDLGEFFDLVGHGELEVEEMVVGLATLVRM